MNKINVLVIGNGGREHALAECYSKSNRVETVFVAPGNDLMSFRNKKIKTLPGVGALAFSFIAHIVKSKKIHLVDVAQDEPLAKGLVDKLSKNGILAFGPTKNASEIEWNKEWAREFMKKYHLPIPQFASFHEVTKAIRYITSHPQQTFFIKASGLALGKGVIKATGKRQAIDAIHAMKQFGDAAGTFLIEHGLTGNEFSLFALCDGQSYKVLHNALDHKTLMDGDQGPNTGGMGCVSPTKLVNDSLIKKIEKTILDPFMQGMQQQRRPYKGILYLGGIVEKGIVKIIEFNARWGDPEAEVILPSIQTDYSDIVFSSLNGTLDTLHIVKDNKVRVSIAGCARGYPFDISQAIGKEVYGLLDAMTFPGISVYGAGILRKGKRFFVKGGRVFHLVAQGETFRQARSRAYAAMSSLFIEGNNLCFRTDIGWKDAFHTFS